MSLVKQILGEARPTQAMNLLSALLKGARPEDLKVVDTWSQADGFSSLIRMGDGQAYEIQIRPAAYAKHSEINRHYGSGRGTDRSAIVRAKGRPAMTKAP